MGSQARSSDEKTSPNPGKKSEAVRLLAVVEKSQAPFGESADIYLGLKAKIESGRGLTSEEFQQLERLVKIARDWEKGVESSARTEPEETLAG